MRPSRVLAAALAAGLAAPASADLVRLTDGAILEGEVVETEKTVEIRLATGGSLLLPRERVAGIERRPTPKQVFLERRKALDPSDAEGRLDLADWAKTQGFAQAVENLAREALALDPGSARAQALLGKVLAGKGFLAPEEALRRGYVPLEEGWGRPDDRYAAQEKALGMPPGALDQARRALARGEIPPGLPPHALGVLLHGLKPEPPADAPRGKTLLAEGILARIPGGGPEPAALVALADAGEDLEAAYARWVVAAESRGLLLVCVADPGRIDEALGLLRARGVPPATDARILAGSGSGAGAAWALLARGDDRFSAALLVSNGAPPELREALQTNAAGQGLFLLGDRDEPAGEKGLQALDGALDFRRIPWPRRVNRVGVRDGDRHAWVRIVSTSPGEGPPPGIEVQASPKNLIHIASRRVRSLVLDLSGDLVDLARPVTVIVNGRTAFSGALPADPKRLLDGYAREGDRHRLVSVELPLEIPERP